MSGPGVASCCGHGTHRPTVALADGRWLVVYGDAEFRAADTSINEDGTTNGSPEDYAVVGGARCRIERIRRTVCGMGYEARFVPVDLNERLSETPEGEEGGEG